jgi:tRNA nucleotidyltransferase/poly(A) polymerase
VPPIPTVTVKSGYKPQSIDTSIEADVLMFQLLRQLTPQQKVQRTCAFNRAIRKLAILGIESQYPNLTKAKVRQEFIKRCLGAEWIEVLSSSLDWEKLVIADPIELAQKIASILLPLNIPYVVGGSVASSLLGENRSAQDLDLVIDLEARIAPQLIDAMSASFTSASRL